MIFSNFITLYIFIKTKNLPYNIIKENLENKYKTEIIKLKRI